jgi:hypothetical protein
MLKRQLQKDGIGDTILGVWLSVDFSRNGGYLECYIYALYDTSYANTPDDTTERNAPSKSAQQMIYWYVQAIAKLPLAHLSK